MLSLNYSLKYCISNCNLFTSSPGVVWSQSSCSISPEISPLCKIDPFLQTYAHLFVSRMYIFFSKTPYSCLTRMEETLWLFNWSQLCGIFIIQFTSLHSIKRCGFFLELQARVISLLNNIQDLSCVLHILITPLITAICFSFVSFLSIWSPQRNVKFF